MINRLGRKLTACIGIAALVFAQLAVSAYACPKDAPMGAAPAPTAADPCEHAGVPSPNLCSKHCNDSAQTSNQAPAACAPFVASFTAAVYAPDLNESASAPADPTLFHATSPPATLRNCCLRI